MGTIRMTSLIWLTAILLSTLTHARINVPIDTASTGRLFEGIGAVSAGAPSRLLIDYPEPYRGDILDYLFKPNFGAGFQHLKVEIGGDINSTCGTEPSFAHTRAEFASPNFKRGYEYWLMREAKNRNDSILLDVLEWGAPGWFTGGIFSSDNAQYMVKFLQGAQSAWGLALDYIGGAQNEVHYNRNWLVNTLRPALDAAGFANVKIVAPEGIGGNVWSIATDMKTDAALKNAVYAIGYHYVGKYNTYGGTVPASADAIASGKQLWGSEEWSYSGTGWDKAIAIPLCMAYSYIVSKITLIELWCPIDAYYDNMTWPGVGLMVAHSPWSGAYSLRPAIWGAAHVTQFARPGWRFLDQACGKLSGDGYYMTLVAPNNRDYSIIIANNGAGTDTLSFSPVAGLSNGPIHVWKSDATSQFVQLTDITLSGGRFSITVGPGTIYSLTTTVGQSKGAAGNVAPAPVSFPQNYSDTYEQDSIGMLPKFTQDQSSVFEVVQRPDGGKALCQPLSSGGIAWDSHCNADPFTELGDGKWTDYDISSDVFLQSSGYACVFARIGDAGSCPPKGYSFRLYNTGAWTICKANGTIANGSVAAGANAWHTLKLRCQGTTLSAFVDGTKAGSVSDNTYAAGMAGLGTGWNTALFDNLSIVSLDSLCPIPQSRISATASSAEEGYGPNLAVDGDLSTMWHTSWTVPSTMPQFITLDLGGSYTVARLVYLPRSDGAQNGNITSYTISTSSNGNTFTNSVSGTWADDATPKKAAITPTQARYVRLTAAAGHGNFASAAEIEIYTQCTTHGGSRALKQPAIAAAVSNQFFATGGYFNIPNCLPAGPYRIGIYSPSGRLLASRVVCARAVSLRKVFGISPEVVVVKLSAPSRR